MAVIISLLRAVNVGGHNQIKMEALGALYESLGLLDVRTYVQSGNVVFRTERGLERLSGRIESGIEASFGFRPNVMIRTCAELREVVARNPFAARQDIEPGKLHVNFLLSDPGAAARKKALSIQVGPEELRAEGRELYIYFPNGAGRSKLSTALLEKTLGTPGTSRNWNTVRKLLEMGEQFGG
jgi:uncharacterized protein (DUF1697 family)